VDGMAELLLNSNEKLTIVATGPLTNIAGLLQTHPQLAGHIERISLMGGGIFRGNVTPLAEFNIHTDPEAAAIVFHSGIPITMCGIDVTQKAVIFEKDIPVFRSLGNRSGLAAAELLQMLFTLYPTQDNTLEGCIALHDPCAIAWLMNPGIFTTKSCYVDVETKGTLTDGVTVVDFFDVLKKEPNTLVAYDIDRAAYVDMLYNAIRNLP
jgi:pyrimidine-specific ribonucleoside hydrolase